MNAGTIGYMESAVQGQTILVINVMKDLDLIYKSILSQSGGNSNIALTTVP